MSDRPIRPVRSSDGTVRARRLRLEPHESREIARTDPGEPGTRIHFDDHGRPLALEIAVDPPVPPERIDRVLRALGRPPLSEEEREALEADG